MPIVPGEFSAPLRVCIRVSPRSEFYAKAFSSTNSIIAESLAAMKRNNSEDDTSNSKLMAIEMFDNVCYIIVDLSHHNYDPTSGHLGGNNELPVHMVVFGKDNIKCKTSTNQERSWVNRTIQELHNLNGDGSEPPFLADHSKGQTPHYKRPRCSNTK